MRIDNLLLVKDLLQRAKTALNTVTNRLGGKAPLTTIIKHVFNELMDSAKKDVDEYIEDKQYVIDSLLAVLGAGANGSAEHTLNKLLIKINNLEKAYVSDVHDSKKYHSEFNEHYYIGNTQIKYSDNNSQLIEKIDILNNSFGVYNSIINPFVEPFEKAAEVAEKFDFDSLHILDDGIGILEAISDVVPKWLESILDFFFDLLPFNDIIEMILDEIPLPSIPMGGLLDIFSEMFDAFDNIDELHKALDYINIFDGHDNDYNIPKPISTTQNMYAQTVTDYKVFFVDNNRYELAVFTGVGAMKSNSSGYCNHNSCTGRAWCVNVIGE